MLNFLIHSSITVIWTIKMTSEKYLLFSLDDEKSKKLGEVISSSMCKKIVNLLAESELSENEISRELKVPINTVEYNLKKLIEAGMIERAKHWWSVKGKKIDTYKVANKLIVISPKKSNVYSKLKGIVPVVLISGILTFFISQYYKTQNTVMLGAEKAADIASSISTPVASSGASASNFISQTSAVVSGSSWEWFLIGSVAAIIVFVILNWKKL